MKSVIKYFGTCLFFQLLSFFVSAQNFNFSETEIENRIKTDIYFLASDSIKGREAGTINEKKAIQYISKKYKEIGLIPLFSDSSYIQKFTFDNYFTDEVKNKGFVVDFKNRTKKESANVIGFINNNASQSVVIGAHFDHMGIHYNKENGQAEIFYGADDNASGTAGILEIARYLKQYGGRNNNYVICAFSAEEKGLFGSKYFVTTKLFDTLNINYMIDLDMIGRLGDFGNKLFVNGVASGKWRKILKQNKPIDFKNKLVPDGMNASDDYPFYKKGVPVLFFITGLHKDYHTPQDTPDKINYKGQMQIIKYIESLINKLDEHKKVSYKTPSIYQTLRSYMIYAKMML